MLMLEENPLLPGVFNKIWMDHSVSDPAGIFLGLRELLDFIPIHCLLVTKKKPKAKNSAA